MEQSILKWIGMFILPVIILCSCEQDTLPTEEIISELENEDTEVYTDEELRKILEEEESLMNLEKSDLITDISGMDIQKENPKKVFVHYMPWFQSEPYDGFWGQHWTMANQDPNVRNDDGTLQIASYYYPVIGPYSSNDPDLHEYHFALMKLAGIDGVIFDWYGSRNLYDYSLIQQSTETFVATLENLDMDFAIMYEDRVAVQTAAQTGMNDPVYYAKEDFKYIKEQYFSSPNYLTIDGNKTLFVFGPEYITTENEWNQIFEVFSSDEKPDFLTIWANSDNVGMNAAGEFLWVDKDHLVAHDNYYSTYESDNKITVGSVYPGFESFYEDGGWIEGINTWTIPHKEGRIFTQTLNYTHHQVADFIQLVTWNDFGEGTMIEPTNEFGFMFLQMLQAYTGVHHDGNDLQVVLDLYNARKDYESNSFAKLLLNRSQKYIKKKKLKRAKKIIKAIRRFYKCKRRSRGRKNIS